MKWFYNMKISTKLISAFMVVALLAGVVGVLGILDLRKTAVIFPIYLLFTE